MQGIIHLENIRKKLLPREKWTPVLKGISLDIFKNEYVALMGLQWLEQIYFNEPAGLSWYSICR